MNAVDADWLALSDDASTLDKHVRATNWHFFCLTERVEGWAIADDKEEASQDALRRAMRQIAGSRNAAEAVSIEYKFSADCISAGFDLQSGIFSAR